MGKYDHAREEHKCVADHMFIRVKLPGPNLDTSLVEAGKHQVMLEGALVSTGAIQLHDLQPNEGGIRLPKWRCGGWEST